MLQFLNDPFGSLRSSNGDVHSNAINTINELNVASSVGGIHGEKSSNFSFLSLHFICNVIFIKEKF